MKLILGVLCLIGVAAGVDLLQDGKKSYVMLFDYLYHAGQNWKIELPVGDECLDLPNDAHVRTSSLLTNGNCIVLHKEVNCRGRGLRFEDYTYGYEAFTYLWYADNTAKSIRRCECQVCEGGNGGGFVGTTETYG